jgi:pilus assembly protein TadC
MFDFICTIVAVIITIIPFAFLIRAEIKEDERKNKIEEEKENRLKFFLKRFSESRELDEK